MIYGPPIFEGIPMKTLINEFKEKLKNQKITGVLDAKSKLLNFIGNVTPKKEIESLIRFYLKIFKDDLKKYFKSISEWKFYEEIK